MLRLFEPSSLPLLVVFGPHFSTECRDIEQSSYITVFLPIPSFFLFPRRVSPSWLWGLLAWASERVRIASSHTPATHSHHLIPVEQNRPGSGRFKLTFTSIEGFMSLIWWASRYWYWSFYNYKSIFLLNNRDHSAVDKCNLNTFVIWVIWSVAKPVQSFTQQFFSRLMGCSKD